MSHYFRYPAGSTSYTSTLTLNPAFVNIEAENIAPVQRVLTAHDGTLWSFQASANRPQRYHVTVTHLSATGEGGQGYTALSAFFNTASSAGPNYTINSFDLFHADASTVAIAVRLVSPAWQFEERYINRFSGQFDLAKVV